MGVVRREIILKKSIVIARFSNLLGPKIMKQKGKKESGSKIINAMIQPKRIVRIIEQKQLPIVWIWLEK